MERLMRVRGEVRKMYGEIRRLEEKVGEMKMMTERGSVEREKRELKSLKEKCKTMEVKKFAEMKEVVTV